MADNEIKAGAHDTRERLAPDLPRSAGLERLDQLIVVTRARAWLTLAALALLLGGLIVWALLARVQVTEEVPAALIPTGDLAEVTTPVGGTVESFSVEVGDRVAVADDVAVIGVPGGGRKSVTTANSGAVVAALAVPGQTVSQGAVLAKVIPDGKPRLRAFPPFEIAQELELGGKAIVAVRQSGGGHEDVETRITRIGRVPFDMANVAATIGDTALARLLVDEGRTVAVVELSPQGGQLSGAGSDIPTALIGDATLVLGERHPISFVVP